MKRTLHTAAALSALSALSLTLLISGCGKETHSENPQTENNPITRTIRTAYSTALELLEQGPYSYERLVEDLEWEGFSHEEAVDAADNCGADWYEQALLKAVDYIDFCHCGYDYTLDFLKEFGFTEEQAEYAVENCGADWNEQALLKAAETLQHYPYGYDYIFERLKDYGFTEEQAYYAVENCDWNERALLLAQSSLDANAYSRGGLKSYLLRFFTEEQAAYACDNVDTDWSAQPARYAQDRIDSEIGYSYLGLIDSLEYAEFTHEEAVAAADGCGADWNEQAVFSVIHRLGGHLSRESAKKELLRVGYTEEQALYGVENCGADWNYEALQKALDMSESYYALSNIESSLEYYEFTEDEIAYALDNLDFDWNEQALIYARKMIDGEIYPEGYSRAEIEKNLANKGYSEYETAYALENCIVDWNEQALLRIPYYTNNGRTSDVTFEMMAYVGFTDDEINYALDNCGVDWDNQIKVCVDSFLDIYSRAEIIEKANYCGHSEEDTAREIDSRNIDWAERASARAVSMLEWFNYSYSGMKEHLEKNGFSTEEALYGADNCGADWNEQAVEQLEYYIKYQDDYSREEVFQALADDGFTDEEIAYAAEQKNF